VTDYVSQIENALHGKLSDMPPGVSVAWPGLRFEPSNATPYLRVEVLHAPLRAGQLIGTDAQVYRSGSYIITAVYPISKGPGPLRAKIAALEAHFARRSRISAGTSPNDFFVILSAHQRGQLITEDGWNSMPLTVSWWCLHP
jgi:hypothetical protein